MATGTDDITFKFITQAADISGTGGGSGRSVSGIRSTSSQVKAYIDNSLKQTNNTADSGSIPTIKFVSGGLADSDTTQIEYVEYYSQTEIFGGGSPTLTDTEQSALYTVAGLYNSTLGR